MPCCSTKTIFLWTAVTLHILWATQKEMHEILFRVGFLLVYWCAFCTLLLSLPSCDIASIFLDDGFFPVLSPEISARNRKRCRVIIDGLRGQGPVIRSPLGTNWAGFTPEESEMLKGMLITGVPIGYLVLRCLFAIVTKAR